MTFPTTLRKRTRPIAAAVALALLAGAFGDAFAADPRDKSRNEAAQEKHFERMKKARQHKEAQARPRALPKLQQVRADAAKQPAQAAALQKGPSRAVDKDRINAPAKPRGVAPRANAQVPIPAGQSVMASHGWSEYQRMLKRQHKLLNPVLDARRGHDGVAPARSEASTRSVVNPARHIGGANGARVDAYFGGGRFDGHQRMAARPAGAPSMFDQLPDFDSDDEMPVHRDLSSAPRPMRDLSAMTFGESRSAERANGRAPGLQAVDQALLPAPISGRDAAVVLALGAITYDAIAQAEHDATERNVETFVRGGRADAPLGYTWEFGLYLAFKDVEVFGDRDGRLDVDLLKRAIDQARQQLPNGNSTNVLQLKRDVAYGDLPDPDQIAIVVLSIDGESDYRVVFPNVRRGEETIVVFGSLNENGDLDLINADDEEVGLPDLDPQTLPGKVAFVVYEAREGAE